MRSSGLASFTFNFAAFYWTTVASEDDARHIYALDAIVDAVIVCRRSSLELYELVVDKSGTATKELTGRAEWDAFNASRTSFLDFKLVNSTRLYLCTTLACA